MKTEISGQLCKKHRLHVLGSFTEGGKEAAKRQNGGKPRSPDAWWREGKGEDGGSKSEVELVT